MPLTLTILIAKLVRSLSRLTGRGGGSALPGLITERFDPGALAKLGGRFPEGVVIVTGTNGKTTTTKMLAAIMESRDKAVLTNRSGSNLTRGLLSTMIDAIRPLGFMPYDVAVLEVDEASMPAACAALQPKAIVVLNLFRDQLDRYGELDKTARLIGQGIESATLAQVWLNADDPLVSSLESYAGARAKFFGVERTTTKKLTHDMAADSDHCPLDGRALEYSKAFYSHLGHYRCPGGDFARPEPAVSLDGGYVKTHTSKVELTLKLPGLYNQYNALAAAAVATGFGIELTDSAAVIASVEAAFGRVEIVEWRGRKLHLLLIKNPTGFNQVIQTFLIGDDPKPLLMIINDKFADGRDVSWLWDVAFEELTIRGPKPEDRNPNGQDRPQSSGLSHQVIASGIRAADLALRLKYAEIETATEPEVATALTDLLSSVPEGGEAYVLPTYTAMFELRKLLSEQSDIKEFFR